MCKKAFFSSHPSVFPIRRKSAGKKQELHFDDFFGVMAGLGFEEALIHRIDRKCNTANGHMQHVAEYTRVICSIMGYDPEQTHRISCAALLHDIGKLEIPESILFDPGRLNEEAFAQIRFHSPLGSQILSQWDGPVFQLAAEVALQHHERIDGSGYLGLRGEEISLPAKIVAVADVFDALTAERPYKQSWDFDTAFSYIQKNRDIHFDAKVVENFVRNKAAIHQVYHAIHTGT